MSPARARVLATQAARALTLALILALSGCGKPPAPSGQAINFSILSAEDQQSMGRVWQPLVDQLNRATGLNVKPFYSSNYAALIEAMRFRQTQAGWFSALTSLEAVRRADGKVIARVLTNGRQGSYQSVIIVRKGSGITLDGLLECGRKLTFGMGDPKSTSGTLAPLAYVFLPRGIEPANCFKTVKSASHQANFFAVANGVLDAASNNTVGLLFYARENPELAKKIEVIWTSPPLPESAIVVRKDLDPAIKEKLRAFFLSYGHTPGAEGDKQRQVLKAMTYAGFAPADDSYLDPVRQMEAATNLAEAKHTGDRGRIARAQKAFDAVKAELAAKPPPATGG